MFVLSNGDERMNILSAILVFFCELLTAAHFLRSGEMVLFALFTALPFLLFFKSKISYILLHLSLIFSIIIWALCTIQMISYRIKSNMPFMRLSIIMSGVILIVVITQIIFYKNKRYL
jgi:cellulose synthase/poly-beta-1,6-N-acetylglucosamine synthase-like glycosyltransferase